MPPPRPRQRHALRRLPAACALSVVLGLAACTTQAPGRPKEDRLLGFITPYRIEVVQGNVVTREQFQRLRAGMTRQQVGEVLGTPLLTSVFHRDRWDYVFTIARIGAEPQRRLVVVWFDGDLLVRFDASQELPTEAEFIASISNIAPPTRLPTLELTPEQRAALPVPPRPEAGAPSEQPVGPARSYPPLEP
jgi:outer membrane protein assembly factor BamE